MSDFNNINDNSHIFFPNQPIVVIDEYSSTEYYVGTSVNGNNTDAPTWNIKKIWKIGKVWNTGYPNGSQAPSFIWDCRYDYSYR